MNTRHPKKSHPIVSKPFSSKNHFGLSVFGNLIRNIFGHLRAIIRIIREKFVFGKIMNFMKRSILRNILWVSERNFWQIVYRLVSRKRDGFVVTCLILIFRMPSKIPQEAEIDSDDGEEMMPMGAGYPGMPERKEYLWSCDLKGNFSSIIWKGFIAKWPKRTVVEVFRECKIDPFFYHFAKFLVQITHSLV